MKKIKILDIETNTIHDLVRFDEHEDRVIMNSDEYGHTSNTKDKVEILGEVDVKVKELFKLTTNFIFSEYYSHTGKMMWKILNPFTNYKEEVLVLCDIDESIETALDLAIESIKKSKNRWYCKDCINNLVLRRS